MKTKSLLIKPLLAASLAASLLTAYSSRAGLNVPYTVDANTLHLWHFDAPTNTLITTDEVQTASITLTNVVQTNIPPDATIALGAPGAIPGLNTSLEIIPTNGNAGSSVNAFAIGGNPATTNAGWASNNFENTTTGAFTIEALVKPEGNPAVAGNGNWEVVCGDNSGNNGLTRGWQFRIQTAAAPTLDFNFIGAGGGNFQPSLPITGADAALPGLWYHMAVTYTGGSPTNGDTPGLLTFYWTLLDAGRTNADVVPGGTFSSTAFGITGTPVLGIGGSSRNYPGTIANGEGFKGSIDEVRISSVCRKANEMVFITGGVPVPPQILHQPATNTLIGYGQTLTLTALVSASPTATYTWKQGGVTLPTQTNSTLVIPNATFAAGGAYQLFCSNGVTPPATSVVANVTIGAGFGELFDTGTDNTGTVINTGAVSDAHYFLTHSSDTNNLGPATQDWNMAAFPIASAGGNFSNPDGASAWIGTQANSYTSPVGGYTYRTTFLLDSVDTTQPMTLSGIWYVNELGSNILINGSATGFTISSAGSSSGKFPFNFKITNGFHPGLNTLDFVTARTGTANGSYLESAVRVEMTGIGLALPAGLPTILANPVSVTNFDAVDGGADTATFAVVATGRPPLTYLWYGSNSPGTVAPVSVAGVVNTNRTLVIANPFTNNQPINYFCVVTDASGSVTSSVATLVLTTTNIPPVTPNYTNTIFVNTSLTYDISAIWNNITDPNGDLLLPGITFNTNSTLGTVTQAGTILTYTPVTNFTGSDSLTYTVSDNSGQANASSTGTLFINVINPTPPVLSSATVSAGKIVLSGSGGVANGTYHVLATTNVATALTNWTVLGPFNFDGSGNFHYTNGVSASPTNQFFRISVP